MTEETVPGVDAPAITRWLAERVDTIEPPLHFDRIEGGLSNLTFRVRDVDGRRWVLRRPPLHGVIQSAHDMQREHRLMSALADSRVPVPPTVGYCGDESVTGAEFYVMEFVDGPVHRDVAEVEAQTTPGDRRRICESLVEALAALHAVDPDAVGLSDLGRREDYCARQLRRWQQQWEHVVTRERPAFAEVHDRLRAAIPVQQSVAIVHGDYRLDNLICTPDGSVAAVVDWELCTLGDPLADLGILGAYWTDSGEEFQPLPGTATALPGFMRRAELVERYAAVSGRDVADADFYLALAYWRLAAILEGVYARFSSGAYGEVAGMAIDSMPERVDDLVDAALAVTERSGR